MVFIVLFIDVLGCDYMFVVVCVVVDFDNEMVEFVIVVWFD